MHLYAADICTGIYLSPLFQTLQRCNQPVPSFIRETADNELDMFTYQYYLSIEEEYLNKKQKKTIKRGQELTPLESLVKAGAPEFI